MRMKLKAIIPILLLTVSVGVFAFSRFGYKIDPPGRYEAIIQLVGTILKEGHYQPKPIDDAFSQAVAKKYLKILDVEKKFFLQSDIEKINAVDKHIDNELLDAAPLEFFATTNEIIKKRIAEAGALYPEILAKPFDFNTNEKITLDVDAINFPKDEADRKEAWRKMLKYRTLEKLTELQDIQEKSKGKADFKAKSDKELEAEAREKVLKVYDRYFDRLKNKMNDDERFSMFVNAITTTMDPHTDYMPPADKRYFQEQMAGKFYGIGAQLKEEDGRIKIVSIVTGSPSWKQGQLKADDVILKVAQGDKEPVDITGFASEDAVKLIRGAQGTEVRLTVKSTDGTVKTVAIIRDEIVLDETFAKSAIINGSHKIGYIYLPEFYADFNDRNGASCAEDIEKEIKKLKAENVDGIILDLRFNSGGSLPDVVKMAGLFVPEGPVVQVRARGNDVQVLRDRDKNVQYDGPLAIMVNEYSASASEILAAALQDYKRAVIIGSNTFGKGSVQRILELDNFVKGDFGGSLGGLKLTVQKFYRINGGSTQLKGVAPDVTLPDPYYETGERKDPDALKWDEIPKAGYTTWNDPVDVNTLRKNSEKRMANNESFKIINDNISMLKKLDEQKTYPLNITAFKAEQKSNTAALKKYDNANDKVNPLNMNALKVDLDRIAGDSSKLARSKEWVNLRTKDPYLNEAVNVMNDLIGISLPKMKSNNLMSTKN
ncbi:carboxyl-terminal processing protease [Chitinophaga skermanii]|uniref:Carboxyl-terminal processing protease n=1 Tax=Chitinophaga skermanii TaxID=331697 RepID=A0A327QAQ5_9BACT|nr:carboxy terminal-processing peptidase [Chitinophaga skermanii]RAJ00293.1 carboxyl-terminal processing protease [Chitinophaga skermanii]